MLRLTSSQLRLHKKITFAKCFSQDFLTEQPDDWDNGFESEEASVADQSQSKTRRPTFAIYKPNTKEEIGSAFQIHFDVAKKACFFNAAKQKGPKSPPGSTKEQFDWQNKIVFKISITEMGKMLAFLRGKIDTLDLIHKLEKAGNPSTSTFKMKKGSSGGTYGLQVTRQTGKDKPQFVALYIDSAEHSVLEVFLRKAVTTACGFE